MRECLSSKTFIQTIFEYGGTKNKLQEISSFLHEPPVKHLQRFLDILDKLEFEGEEAQQLRFILQTLILTGYKGKTALQPEPLSVENLVKGPDDVGSGGVRSPREFGVTSCPLELDIKSIQEIVRQPFHTSKSPSHSTTPSTYAAQDYRVQPGWQPTWQAQPPYSTSQFNAQSSPTETVFLLAKIAPLRFPSSLRLHLAEFYFPFFSSSPFHFIGFSSTSIHLYLNEFSYIVPSNISSCESACLIPGVPQLKQEQTLAATSTRKFLFHRRSESHPLLIREIKTR